MNKYLQPEDAPVTQERPKLGYVFDTEADRAEVLNKHIKSFDWSKGTGGTISNGTINNVLFKAGTIQTTLLSGGTINNPTISTPTINAGTYNKIEDLFWAFGAFIKEYLK